MPAKALHHYDLSDGGAVEIVQDGALKAVIRSYADDTAPDLYSSITTDEAYNLCAKIIGSDVMENI